MRQTLLYLLAAVAGVLIGVFLLGPKTSQAPQAIPASSLESVRPYLDTIRTAIGQQRATVVAYAGNDIKSLLNASIRREDSLMRLMQEVMDKQSKMGAALAQVLQGQGQTSEIVVEQTDTLPTYRGTIQDNWGRFDIVASPSVIKLDYAIRNELVFWQTVEGRTWRKPGTTVVRAQSTNPNAQVVDMRGFVVQQKPARRARWFAIGLGAGIISGILIAK